MESPQEWRMLCPENRQMNVVNSTWQNALEYDFKEEGSLKRCRRLKFDACLMLARPLQPSHLPVTAPGNSYRNTQISVPNLSKLESLSNEILDMVIQYLLPVKSDAMGLGLSSERLWPLVRLHIQRQILECAAPWAGKKISFQGSYSTDLPASFLDDGLAKRIIGSDGYGSMCDAQRLFRGGDGKFITPPTRESVLLEWKGGIIAHAGRILIPGPRWEEMERDMECSQFFPRNQPWILRNLTTRESVSSEKLGVVVTMKLEHYYLQGIAAFTLILLMRTCWTNYPTSGGSGNLNIHRGVWAGHRFDVVAQQVHESEENLEDWCDVTKVVSSEAEELRRKLTRRRY